MAIESNTEVVNTSKIDNSGVDEKQIISKINNIAWESKNYRNTYSKRWKEIVDQINSDPPTEWQDKDDWQTQIFIPLQFKISETACAIMEEILFGNRDFFSVVGVNSKIDKVQETNIRRLIMILLEKGDFFINNQRTLQEAINIGTSFIKFNFNFDKGLWFSYRGVQWVGQDPMSIINFNKDSRYFVEEYNEDIYDIMNNPLYDLKRRQELGEYLNGNSDKTKISDLISLTYSEGNYQLQVSKQYAHVNCVEFHGYLPVKKTRTDEKGKIVEYEDMELRVVNIADNKIILRNELIDSDMLPYERCIIKRRMYHPYGHGFCDNLSGFQSLINSLVNLGMDSAKLKGVGVVIMDETAVADETSIVIKPMQKWLVRDGRMADAPKIEYLGEDNTRNMINQILTIDQQAQEASGINKAYQGQDNGAGGQETLGQTQIKMATAEKRFNKIARECSEDYVIPVIKHVFKFITHPKYRDYFQKIANDTIGVDFIENPMNQHIVQADMQTGTKSPLLPQIQKPRLDLSQIGEADLHFKFIGLVNYNQKTKVPEQMQQILRIASSDPTIGMFIKKDVCLERWMESSDVDDVNEIMTNEQEREAIRQQLSMATMNQQMQPQGGKSNA